MDLREAPFVLSLPQFPHHQNILSLMASHVFLCVPNSCFQPEHNSQNQGASWRLLGEEAGEVTFQRYNPSPSTLTSRDPEVLWSTLTTKSLASIYSSVAAQDPGQSGI